MRRRDRIYFGVLGVATALHIAVAVSAVAFHWYHVRRLVPRVDDLESGLRAETQARADALCAARAEFGAAVASSPSSASPSNAVASPVLLGYGQTKSQKQRYVYADYRYPDGSVQRKYVANFPLEK